MFGAPIVAKLQALEHLIMQNLYLKKKIPTISYA